MTDRKIPIIFTLALAIFLIFMYSAISPVIKKLWVKSNPKEEVIAEINGYTLTKSDFADELKNLGLLGAYKRSPESTRKDVLEKIIKKQIMLQEAQKLNLDKNKDFMATIQRYWEQALIKSLLKEKEREISAKMPAAGPGAQAQAMQAWLEEIRLKSKIYINKKSFEEFSLK